MIVLYQDDLANLDIAAGQCVNKTIQQNITFGEQRLPFGINLGNGKKSAAASMPSNSIAMMLVVAVVTLFVGQRAF